MTAVEMPPPGWALTLNQAAAKLRDRAAKARAEAKGNDYWNGGWARGVENAIGGAEGVLAGMFTPDMADEIADWLDSIALEAVKHAAGGMGNCESEICDGYPTTLARRILEAK